MPVSSQKLDSPTSVNHRRLWPRTAPASDDPANACTGAMSFGGRRYLRPRHALNAYRNRLTPTATLEKRKTSGPLDYVSGGLCDGL